MSFLFSIIIFFCVVLWLELEVDDEDEDSSLSTTFGLGSKDGVDARSPASVARSFMKSLDEDPLYPCFIILNQHWCDHFFIHLHILFIMAWKVLLTYLNKGWEKGHRIYFFFSSNQLNLVLHWDFGNKSWWESEIPLSDIKLHLMPAWNFNLLLLYYHSNWRVYGVEIIFIECWKMADNAR